MLIGKRNYRAGPYIEELLSGGYVHNPTKYIEGSYGPSRKYWVSRQHKYQKSWYNALNHLKQEYDVTIIPNRYGGDHIYILEKFFAKFLKKRVIEQTNGYTLCRIEERNLLFNPGDFPEGVCTVVHCKYSIKDIITKSVEYALDKPSGLDGEPFTRKSIFYPRVSRMQEEL